MPIERCSCGEELTKGMTYGEKTPGTLNFKVRGVGWSCPRCKSEWIVYVDGSKRHLGYDKYTLDEPD